MSRDFTIRTKLRHPSLPRRKRPRNSKTRRTVKLKAKRKRQRKKPKRRRVKRVMMTMIRRQLSK